MKKWLSRGIVLAMIIAMMVPMPVAAKSSKGGKLVKSVTVYSLNSAKTGWEAKSKTTYTYDKKNNPKEIRTVTYHQYLFGVPVNGSLDVTTAKYKYKGKKAKSAKFMNEAGTVMEQSSYKNGKPVSTTYTSAESWEDGTADAGADQYTETSAVNFDKNGLPMARMDSWSSQGSGKTEWGDDNTHNNTGIRTVAYAWSQKKGIPSLVYTTKSSSENGGAASTPEMYYSVFDGKGLAIESGYMENNVVPKPSYKFTYGMKKGKVNQVIVYNDEGKAVRMYEFKYNKTKISKTRYMSMINNIINSGAGYYDEFIQGDFSWY